MTSKTLLNINQAAERLNMLKSRIYFLVFKKQIPHLKIGNSLRFDPDEIDEWLKSKQVEASND